MKVKAKQQAGKSKFTRSQRTEDAQFARERKMLSAMRTKAEIDDNVMPNAETSSLSIDSSSVALNSNHRHVEGNVDARRVSRK